MGNSPSTSTTTTTTTSGSSGGDHDGATSSSIGDNDASSPKRRRKRRNSTNTSVSQMKARNISQLRAKSFLEREQHDQDPDIDHGVRVLAGANAAFHNGNGDTEQDFQDNNNNNNDNGDDNSNNNENSTIVDQLQLQTQQLSEKCAALESQNILVPVQQLDIFAQVSSMILCLVLLYYVYYRTAVVWLTTTTTADVPTVSTETTTGTNGEQQLQQEMMRLVSFLSTGIRFVTVGLSHLSSWLEDYYSLSSLSSSSSFPPSAILDAWNTTTSFAGNYFSWMTTIPLFFYTSWIRPLFCCTVRLILLSLPYIYDQYYRHGATYRRVQVFCIAAIVVTRVRMCRWRERYFLQSDDAAVGKIKRYGEACTNDGIWEANYEISARFLYLSIFRLRGLWTKTAQYLSSRADFMPVSYIRELSKLQDQAPATEWKDIQATLNRGGGTILSSYNKKKKKGQRRHQLVNIQETPIASASIGQVHVGYLEQWDDDGKTRTTEKVAIKVQHPHAYRLMTDDFWSLKVLTRVLAWLEPEYAFMEILIREWSLEARKELDFRYEADHLRDARKALESMYEDDDEDDVDGTGTQQPKQTSVLYTTEGVPFQVEVPEPIDDLCTRDVLVMKFCEGCRIDDFAQIEKWNLSRDAIMDAISRTFAHFMYCSTIFNGDPHAGNILVRPGVTTATSGDGNDKATQEQQQKEEEPGSFTLTILDWGLAKRLPESKRLAFCQMVYAAATMDYGLLLDSYKFVGLRMKREDTGQSMEDMRFFLRDMAPRKFARDRIKKKIKADVEKAKRTKEKVPMESKAYPGEFFFFIRVNELLHGLGSRFDVNLGYLDTLRPYAEKGLRQSTLYDSKPESSTQATPGPDIQNVELQLSLQTILNELKDEGSIAGSQVCVLDKDGKVEANLVAGSLGGLRSHIPMQENALILGYSTTKAVAATVAHIMVEEGYLSYDEPVCERVWKAFCPMKYPNAEVGKAMHRPIEETVQRWEWKRQITLRHILNHTAGFGFSLPSKLTIQKLASCEECFASYEYNPEAPEETILPTHPPGEKSEYHFMSFGWLVAGTLCGAFSLARRKQDVTFAEVYRNILEKRLSPETKTQGFRPVGISPDGPTPLLAQTVTSDIRASSIMQRMRDNTADPESAIRQFDKGGPASEMFKTFRGKEFLLDPRIWNSSTALTANVPAAGGRFSAAALANFYSELGRGKLVSQNVLDSLNGENSVRSSTSTLQGVTRITNDSDMSVRSQLCLGYQLLQTERDEDGVFSCVGHAGVGGSIGFWHRPTGLCVGIMLNKADADQEVTIRIVRAIANHYGI